MTFKLDTYPFKTVARMDWTVYLYLFKTGWSLRSPLEQVYDSFLLQSSLSPQASAIKTWTTEQDWDSPGGAGWQGWNFDLNNGKVRLIRLGKRFLDPKGPKIPPKNTPRQSGLYPLPLLWTSPYFEGILPYPKSHLVSVSQSVRQH